MLFIHTTWKHMQWKTANKLNSHLESCPANLVPSVLSALQPKDNINAQYTKHSHKFDIINMTFII